MKWTFCPRLEYVEVSSLVFVFCCADICTTGKDNEQLWNFFHLLSLRLIAPSLLGHGLGAVAGFKAGNERFFGAGAAQPGKYAWTSIIFFCGFFMAFPSMVLRSRSVVGSCSMSRLELLRL